MPEHTTVHSAESGPVIFESQVHLILIQSVTISALRTLHPLLLRVPNNLRLQILQTQFHFYLRASQDQTL